MNNKQQKIEALYAIVTNEILPKSIRDDAKAQIEILNRPTPFEELKTILNGGYTDSLLRQYLEKWDIEPDSVIQYERRTMTEDDKKLTEELLREDKLTIEQIAEKVGFSPGTIRKRKKELGLARPYKVA